MASNKKKTKSQKEIDVYYPKAANHQTVHADGAWAALTTQLEIQVAFYKELQPMPRKVRYRITPEGRLGEVVETDSDRGIVREAAMTIVLDPAVAMQLIQLLQGMLDKARPQMEAQMKQAQKALSEAQAHIDAQTVDAK